MSFSIAVKAVLHGSRISDLTGKVERKIPPDSDRGVTLENKARTVVDNRICQRIQGKRSFKCRGSRIWEEREVMASPVEKVHRERDGEKASKGKNSS